MSVVWGRDTEADINETEEPLVTPHSPWGAHRIADRIAGWIGCRHVWASLLTCSRVMHSNKLVFLGPPPMQLLGSTPGP
jgi:hypothetical protein